MDKGSSRRTSVTIRNIRLTSLFKPEDIIHHTDATSEREVIRQLLQHLALTYGIGNINVAMEEVVANIAKEDISVRPGVAVLYGRLDSVINPLIAIATSEKGIEVDGKVAHLIAVVLSPTGIPGAYKQILHGIATACDSDDSPAKVAALNSPLSVWQHFDSGGHHLPDHLQARHIMSTQGSFLKSTDSLAQAIDLFLVKHVSELPVLTPNYELIGVVTTRKLVNVCMPDYLLWMEDMTPMLNFEPIAEIIRNASSTWLKDIMNFDYAHVLEDSPAVEALREIGRKGTDNAYVLRGRKLVGVIYLHEFLNSVLR